MMRFFSFSSIVIIVVYVHQSELHIDKIARMLIEIFQKCINQNQAYIA